MASKQDDLQKDLDIIKGNDEVKERKSGAKGPGAARQQIKAKKKKKSLPINTAIKDNDSKVSLAAVVRNKVAHKRGKTLSPTSIKSKTTVKSRRSLSSAKPTHPALGRIKVGAKLNSSTNSDNSTPNKNPPLPKKSTPRSRGSMDPDAIPLEAIQFVEGSRIEAVDHGQWYKAKIVRVDNDKMEILVHFDGWGSKFDTWYPMTSTLIRGRTEIQTKDEVAFIEGEDVLARWTDGNYYPATVITVKDSGSCIVMYFDGMKKLIRKSLMKKMNEKEKKIATEAANKLLLLAPSMLGGPLSPTFDTPNKTYRTSANDREKRARRGRLSDSGSIDSASENVTTPQQTTVTPQPKTPQPQKPPNTREDTPELNSKRKRGRPRKDSRDVTPAKEPRLDTSSVKKETPQTVENKSCENNLSKNSSQNEDLTNIKENVKVNSKAINEEELSKPKKAKIEKAPNEINSPKISSTVENHTAKINRLDNITSKIGPNDDKVQDLSEIPPTTSKDLSQKSNVSSARPLSEPNKTDKFCKGSEVVATLNGNSYRCIVLKKLDNDDYKVQLKRDSSEMIVKESDMKLSCIPPLRIPLTASMKRDHSPLTKDSTNLSPKDPLTKNASLSSKTAQKDTNVSKTVNKTKPIESPATRKEKSLDRSSNLQEKVQSPTNLKKDEISKPVTQVAKTSALSKPKNSEEPKEEVEDPSKVIYCRDEIVMVEWEGLWYQAKMLKRVNHNSYKVQFLNGVEKVFKENAMKPWKPSESKGNADKTVDKSPPLPASKKPSERTHSTELKSRVKVPPPLSVEVGEVVLARWVDCKSYPATVIKINKNNDLVVKYYDGFTRTLSPNLVKQWAPKTQLQSNIAPTSSLKIDKMSEKTVKPKDKPRTVPSPRHTVASTSTSNVETDHHKFKCRAPECNKTFRKESLMLQHHKHYHHQRYKFRDQDNSTLNAKKRKISKEDASTPKRRVSADYEAIMSKTSQDLAPPLESPEVIRSRGGKPPMNIYRERQGEPIHDTSTGDEAVLSADSTPQSVEETPPGLASNKPEASPPKKRSRISDGSCASSLSAAEEVIAPVTQPPEEEVVNEDIIRCSCEDDDETGMMIQCDGCFTWQHMSCAENDKTLSKLPVKPNEIVSEDHKGQEVKSPKDNLSTHGYYCYVCVRPPKSRNSEKYFNYKEFLTTGVLRDIVQPDEDQVTYNKLPDDIRQMMLMAVNELVEELVKVHGVLTGVKLKLKIASDTENALLKLWKEPERPCDKMIKHEENTKKTETSNGDSKIVNHIPLKSTSDNNSAKSLDDSVENMDITPVTPEKINSCDNDEDFAFKCRENLLDHIIDLEKTLMDRLTQLDGYIDVLQPLFGVDHGDPITIAKNLTQIERDLSSMQELLYMSSG